MEQRAVIRFLTLKGQSAKSILSELMEVYHQDALCLTAVKKWRKRFLKGRTSLEDDLRIGRPKKSDLADPLLQLLQETPFISCKCMCCRLKISKTTCLRVLHEDLGMQKFHCRWVPHELLVEQRNDRLVASEHMLEILESLNGTDFSTIITGDESWFFYEYSLTSAWARVRDDVPKRANQNFQAKKCLISILWSPAGIHSLLAVPKGTTYNSLFFCAQVVPDLVLNITSNSRRKTLKGLTLHIDNARPHNSKVSVNTLARTKAKRFPHPPYSPDLAPSDFFLFGYIKEKMSGVSSISEQDVIDRIKGIFNEIPKEVLISVYIEWIHRLKWVIKNGGEYYFPS
jgi:histone-lysine N-methyltransferase SETMAR